MRTLALDTSTARGSVAFRRDGALLDTREGDAGRPHATRLPGDLLDLLSDHGTSLRDLTLLAVGLGPGAFTGLRVGLAAMQGLAFATSLPIVGISGLDAVAAAAAREAGPGRGSTIGVWLDAARREVFAARYQVDPAALFGVTPLDEPVAGAPAGVLDRWRDEGGVPGVWVGSGAGLYESLLREGLALSGPVLAAGPLAPTMAMLAEKAFAAGLQVAPHALRPVYVRRPDAELARDRRRGPHVESETRS